MNLYKKISFLFAALILVSSTVYYMGCASAESTTGKLAFTNQDYAKAEVELKKGLAVDKTDDEGWFMLGYSQVELGKYDEARNSFKQSLSISKNFGDRIRSYWVEKYNQGATEFESGIKAEEKNDKSSAKTYYENALRMFEASSAIIPDSLKSFSAMGETYLALGQTDKALEIFNSLSEKSNNPKDAERVGKVLFESGLGMMSTMNYPAAIATFKKIVSIPTLEKSSPYYETSAYNLALALAKTGEDMRTKDENSDYKAQFSEALTYLEPLSQNLTKKDLEPQVWELLVSVYANLGMTDKAQDALNKKESLKKN